VRPILLNACGSAATADEARFRIDRPIGGRSARIVALDEEAAEVARRAAEQPWHDARFYTAGDPAPPGDSTSPDIALRTADGAELRLSEELEGADVTIMIATSDDGAEAASVIAQACARRGIMMAGLILGDRHKLGAAISALRPYAPVLMVSGDEDDVSEVLTALRA
jgi:hypothetical protein